MHACVRVCACACVCVCVCVCEREREREREIDTDTDTDFIVKATDPYAKRKMGDGGGAYIYNIIQYLGYTYIYTYIYTYTLAHIHILQKHDLNGKLYIVNHNHCFPYTSRSSLHFRA